MNEIIWSNVVHISVSVGKFISFPRERSTKGNHGNYHRKIFSDLYIPGYEISSLPLPTGCSHSRDPFFLLYIKKTVSTNPARLQFFPSCIFRLFHPFLSLLTLFPDHPLSSPWKSTLLPSSLFTRPPCSPILENPNEILKVREIWYSSPFTLPLFAAAMLATRLQTSRKTRVKLIETNGRFCFRLRFNWYY